MLRAPVCEKCTFVKYSRLGSSPLVITLVTILAFNWHKEIIGLQRSHSGISQGEMKAPKVIYALLGIIGSLRGRLVISEQWSTREVVRFQSRRLGDLLMPVFSRGPCGIIESQAHIDFIESPQINLTFQRC